VQWMQGSNGRGQCVETLTAVIAVRDSATCAVKLKLHEKNKTTDEAKSRSTSANVLTNNNSGQIRHRKEDIEMLVSLQTIYLNSVTGVLQ
jgi:hypothetical protein